MANKRHFASEGASVGLFDLVELSPAALLENLNQSDFDGARQKLAQAGVLDMEKSASFGPLWMVLNLRPRVGALLGSAVAKLAFTKIGDRTYRLAERSVLTLNGLRHLRNAGYAVPWPEAYDGKANYIGPFPPDCTSLLAAQLCYVQAAVEELVEQLGHAFGAGVTSRDETIRVRSVEWARDIEVDASRQLVLLLAHSMLNGACAMHRDVYRSRSKSDRGYLSLRWFYKRGGPALKVYAKAPRLPRLEVQLKNRPAVRSAQGGKAVRAPFTGPGARQLLTELIPCLTPLLNSVHAQVDEVIAGEPLPSELGLALAPMLAAMSGAPTGGRPSAPETVLELHHAYNALAVTGEYRATKCRPDSALGKLLRQLSANEWPLVKHPTRHRYTLHPRLVRAMCAQTSVAGDWTEPTERVGASAGRLGQARQPRSLEEGGGEHRW